jgi:hypothetical protein
LRRATLRSRASCVEYLDNVLPGTLRALVVPVIEPMDGPARYVAMMRAVGATEPANARDALRALALHDEPWLRAVGAAALIETGSRSVPRRDGEDDARVRNVLAWAAR